jgi:hypothetical protein
VKRKHKSLLNAIGFWVEKMRHNPDMESERAVDLILRKIIVMEVRIYGGDEAFVENQAAFFAILAGCIVAVMTFHDDSPLGL